MANYSIPYIVEEMRKLKCRVCEIEGMVFTLTERVDGIDGQILTINNTLIDHEGRITYLEGAVTINFTVVPNYSALPDPTTVPGQFFWVEDSEGTPWLPGSWGGTYHEDGLYYSTGTAWDTKDMPLNAPQMVVDAGTDDVMFMTSKTFTNSAQLAAKADRTFAIAMAAAL
jgi:hypothetical protein